MKTSTNYGGIGSDTVEAKTGRSWSQWIAALDKAGADKWKHKEIAEFVHTEFGCPGWWSQMVTVGYEQAKGLRVAHQKSDGFAVSVSKTVPAPVARLYKAWADAKVRDRWLVGAKKMVIRKATPNKSMRITWTDGKTSVEVMFYPKGAAKSQVTVQHSKLAKKNDVEMMRTCWRQALTKMEACMTDGAKKPAATRKK